MPPAVPLGDYAKEFSHIHLPEDAVIEVRQLRDDAKEIEMAQKLFVRGMWCTIVPNFWTSTAVAPVVLATGLSLASSLTGAALWGLLRLLRLRGTVSGVPDVQLKALFTTGKGILSLAFVAAPLGLFAGYIYPRKASRDYIAECLEKDMLNPFRHYVARPKDQCHQGLPGNFWVAVAKSQGSETIVGTVAVESAIRPDGHVEPFALSGDAELRRMSVLPQAQGRGVSKKLFAELERFCAASGYKRVYLGTSTMQATALRLYPAVGMRVEGCVSMVLGVARGTFYVKEL